MFPSVGAFRTRLRFELRVSGFLVFLVFVLCEEQGEKGEQGWGKASDELRNHYEVFNSWLYFCNISLSTRNSTRSAR